MQYQPIFSLYRKSFVNKSEIVTFYLQKVCDLQGLVKGLFSPAKKLFLLEPLTIGY